ncbi:MULTISPECIES: hypothetical protein [unclassified Frankia]
MGAHGEGATEQEAWDDLREALVGLAASGSDSLASPGILVSTE